MDSNKIIFLFLLASAIAFAHDHGDAWEELNIPNPADILYVGATIALIGIIAALILSDRASNPQKKLIFIIIAVPVALITIYLSATTVYLNIKSETGGPVHWHADYEIWACGEKFELIDPTGIENRVGTPLVHEHNDNRIHIEGVLLYKSDADLSEFFEAIGGGFTKTGLALPTNEGMKSWSNGDLCNGKTAKWYMFVNGEANEEFEEYIPSPYPNVPPGDRIKLVFTEKSPNEINGELGEEP